MWKTTPPILMDSGGRIVKATGGFYYVQTKAALVECRGRGLLRKEGVSPVVGDMVTLRLSPEGTGTVETILPRKNELIRPPLANLEQMVLVVSVCDPEPNLFVIDTFLAVLEHKGIAPLLAFTKVDLESSGEAQRLTELYGGAGFSVLVCSSQTGEGIEQLMAALAGKLSAFSGNSGVGKSSLLNAIDPRLSIPTGITSKKLGRGKHTTRHVEVFTLPNGGLVADTPGFSSVDLLRMSDLRADALADCFREIIPYTGKCRFADCKHLREAGCAVLRAVEQQEIACSRFQSYKQMYEQLKDVKEWERKT